MSKLAEICQEKINHIANQKAKISFSSLEQIAKNNLSSANFLKAIQTQVQQKKIALIAEIKKASPSKGIIRENFNPIHIAQSYEKGGATCISVLTDEPYFMGCDDYLTQAHQATTLPILRKDFILDPYQVTESKALGADCILLIMAALSLTQAAELEAAAIEYNLDVLIEVHNSAELEMALKLKSILIGVNNRDLKTLKIDLNTAKNLSIIFPKEYVKVCESGIITHSDVVEMTKYGYQSFLVGESLMQQENIEFATKNLLGQ